MTLHGEKPKKTNPLQGRTLSPWEGDFGKEKWKKETTIGKIRNCFGTLFPSKGKKGEIKKGKAANQTKTRDKTTEKDRTDHKRIDKKHLEPPSREGRL